jgi:hypothetical protein
MKTKGNHRDTEAQSKGPLTASQPLWLCVSVVALNPEGRP